MELLVFGHDGTKVLVFPTSMGRFFEYEDNKMIAAVADRIDAGQLQDLLRGRSGQRRLVQQAGASYWRLQRHLQYEGYILNDVLPLMWHRDWNAAHHRHRLQLRRLSRCQLCLRHPDKVTGCVTMGGSFDIKRFLNGWYSEDVYFNNPPDYLANCTDGSRYNHMRTVLADRRIGHVLERQREHGRDPARARYSPRALRLGRPQLPRLALVAAHGEAYLE